MILGRRSTAGLRGVASTAATTPLIVMSREVGPPWTLGGRRRAGPQSRTATRFPDLTGGVFRRAVDARWTLGFKAVATRALEGPD